MAKRKDFLEDEDGDLLILNGDLVIGFSDTQHVRDIIQSNVGEWKQFPAIGVGIENYLNSSGKQQEIERKIKIHCESDGYNVNNARVKNLPDGTMDIQPNAELL